MSAIHISTELVESQKARSDLLKWKLVVVATLATIGLGVSGSFKQFELALSLIPFVSAYIDALCLHLSLRVFTIGKWHRTEQAKELEHQFSYMKKYEEFTEQAHECGAYKLEKLTILYSSILVNLSLIAFSLVNMSNSSLKYQWVIIISGVFGLVTTISLDKYFKSTKAKIKAIKSP